MTDGRNFFGQPVKNDLITNDNIRKIATDQGHGCTASCRLNYNYFKNYYKMIAIDLSEQQALDADPKAIRKINLNVNVDRAGKSFRTITKNGIAFNRKCTKAIR